MVLLIPEHVAQRELLNTDVLELGASLVVLAVLACLQWPGQSVAAEQAALLAVVVLMVETLH